MKIFDISQEVFTCSVFPGDPAPERTIMLDMAEGAVCNLTKLSMCAHNGTHTDAPKHFYNNGKGIDEVDINKFVGMCYVYTKNGVLSAAEAKEAIDRAAVADPECAKRILFRGKTTVSEEAAEVFAKEKLYLIGNESQTVGPEDAPMKVHLILLKEEIVLLEGIRLSDVEDGKYLLSAAPLNLGGSDGAPCRAVLIKL